MLKVFVENESDGTTSSNNFSPWPAVQQATLNQLVPKPGNQQNTSDNWWPRLTSLSGQHSWRTTEEL